MTQTDILLVKNEYCLSLVNSIRLKRKLLSTEKDHKSTRFSKAENYEYNQTLLWFNHATFENELVCILVDTDIWNLYKKEYRFSTNKEDILSVGGKLLFDRITGITREGKKVCVDHISGNRFDNRKRNLRILSASGNNLNRYNSLNIRPVSQEGGIQLYKVFSFYRRVEYIVGESFSLKDCFCMINKFKNFIFKYESQNNGSFCSEKDLIEYCNILRKSYSKDFSTWITYSEKDRSLFKLRNKKYEKLLEERKRLTRTNTQKKRDYLQVRSINNKVVELFDPLRLEIKCFLDEDIFNLYSNDGFWLAQSYIRTKKGFLHRLVCPNLNKDLVVDHIDRNYYNNLRSNLRTVSRNMNSLNTAAKDNIPEGYRAKGTPFYRVQFCYAGKPFISKSVFLKEDCAKIRNTLVRQVFKTEQKLQQKNQVVNKEVVQEVILKAIKNLEATEGINFVKNGCELTEEQFNRILPLVDDLNQERERLNLQSKYSCQNGYLCKIKTV